MTLSPSLSRYLIVTPPLSWAYQISSAKNLKIAVVGGSNSQGHGTINYPAQLREYIKKYPDSYLFNLAVGSAIGDIHFFVNCIGSNNDLSQKFQSNDPPNLWLIDFSINLAESDINQAELLLFSIWNLYDLRNLTRPSILFIDLFSPRDFYMPSYHFTGMFGMPTVGTLISRLARFYDIPFLSFTDYLLHEFIHHYRHHCIGYDMHDEKCVSPLFLNDRHHFSFLAHQLCMENLLIPLLEDALKFDLSIPYFPRILPYTYQVHKSHRSISDTCQVHQLPAYPTLKYLSDSFKNYEYMQGRYCLADSRPNSIIQLPFPTLGRSPKSVGVMSLKSWNMSYVGVFDCRLDTEKTQNWIEIHPKATILGTRIEPTMLHLSDEDLSRSSSIICRTKSELLVCITGLIVHY